MRCSSRRYRATQRTHPITGWRTRKFRVQRLFPAPPWLLVSGRREDRKECRQRPRNDGIRVEAAIKFLISRKRAIDANR
jgi:hypothetical protein